MRTGNQRVLVGIDGSGHAVKALGWALQEAASRGDSVEAVYVWQVPSLAYSAPGYIPIGEGDVEKQGRKCLEEALSQLTVPASVEVNLVAVEGSPVEVLSSLAAEDLVSEVVVGARGHGGVAGLLLGSVSHALTHHCPKPLTVVPADWDSADREFAHRRIVVGIDGSESSDRALAWAISSARSRGVAVDAVMVLPHLAHVPTGSPGDEGAGVTDDPGAVKALAEYVSRVDATGVEVRQVLLSGQVAHALTDRSSLAQLLVIGTRGHGWARETLSGSVSHSCTHRALVPVAVIPKPH